MLFTLRPLMLGKIKASLARRRGYFLFNLRERIMCLALGLLILSETKASLALNCCPKAPLSQVIQAPGEITSERYPSLMVFVSFSMPLETLKTLGKQLEPLGGRLIFRGLYQNSFRQTAEKVKALGCEALIDPSLFRHLGFTKVPVFFIKKGFAAKKEGTLEGDWVAGHLTLPGALAILARHQVQGAKKLLQKLRKDTWSN